jgi:hypothetical protein
MGSRNKRYGNKFLEGPQQAAMLRAIFPQAAFLPNEPAVHAPINLQSLELISEVAALIDSGATDNFISPQVVQCFKMPTRDLDKPKSIQNIDGTPNRMGAIEQVPSSSFDTNERHICKPSTSQIWEEITSS